MRLSNKEIQPYRIWFEYLQTALNDKNFTNKVNKKESEILKIIETYSSNSVSFYEFVNDINKNYTKEEKLSLLGFMWRVAYADGNLEVDEERLIRRLANMINIKDIFAIL